MTLTLISQHRCFDGAQRFYAHESRECHTEMRFSVFIPPQAQSRKVPVLYYLAGLTCTEETFMIKAGAQRLAAELGLMLVAPDTSPRKARLAGDAAADDFGIGAGFYVDATQAPWSQHYRMYSYVTRELPEVVQGIGVASDRRSIFGHSMGGHGALICALKNPGRYASVSAFAPICSPSRVPWGQKAFAGYFGSDQEKWREYDAVELLSKRKYDKPILIDQGTADKFSEVQLKPQLLEEACRQSNTELRIRYRAGYDHGYYFISSFVSDHLRHHATYLQPI